LSPEGPDAEKHTISSTFFLTQIEGIVPPHPSFGHLLPPGEKELYTEKEFLKKPLEE
jgi:hypothetical protein